MAFPKFFQKGARKPIKVVTDMGSECGGLRVCIPGDARGKWLYTASMLHVSWHVVRYGSNCSLDRAAIAVKIDRRTILPGCTPCIAAAMPL